MILKRHFHPVVFLTIKGNEARILLTVEKDDASIFQTADLTTTVADTSVELHCLQEQLLT